MINDGLFWDHMWNQGWGLRNDGVSISQTDWSLGWISPSEWLRYTVTCRPGVYQVNVNSSRMNTSATFHITLDGAPLLGPVNPPVT